MDRTLPSRKTQIFFSQMRKKLFLFLPDTELREQVQASFQEKHLQLVGYDDLNTALNQLRTNTYRQILLEDNPASQALLTEISSWAGGLRRFVFLVLLGKRGPSLDTQLAFRLGVDSYIHIQDIEQIVKIFEQGQKSFLERNSIWIEERELLTVY